MNTQYEILTKDALQNLLSKQDSVQLQNTNSKPKKSRIAKVLMNKAKEMKKIIINEITKIQDHKR